MRVVSVVGARPQFVKAALLSREMARRGFEEWLVHTGQHYDERMSDVFFSELSLPKPYCDLGVGSGSHAAQTAKMMLALENVIVDAEPDCVLIYGDTNSTLAAALVTAKLNIPLVHVEAGLRSYDLTIPEEVNRRLSDHVSTLLLVPSEVSAEQLRRENVQGRVEIVGDLMVDLAVQESKRLPARPAVLDRFSLTHKGFAAVTIHRPHHTDDAPTFGRIIAGLRRLDMPVVFPVHPRTRKIAEAFRVGCNDNITTCEPLSYLDMLALQLHARAVVTDSGGMQKEAVTLGTPCVTLRDRTEWVETLEHGWNRLADTDPVKIAELAMQPAPATRIHPYGEGNSAARIVDAMLSAIPEHKSEKPCAS